MGTQEGLIGTYMDIAALGFMIGVATNYWKVLHAPNSRDVINATFRGKDSCYKLSPVVVPCIS